MGQQRVRKQLYFITKTQCALPFTHRSNNYYEAGASGTDNRNSRGYGSGQRSGQTGSQTGGQRGQRGGREFTSAAGAGGAATSAPTGERQANAPRGRTGYKPREAGAAASGAGGGPSQQRKRRGSASGGSGQRSASQSPPPLSASHFPPLIAVEGGKKQEAGYPGGMQYRFAF